MPTINAWYRFIETGGQKWVVFDGKLIPKQDEILESCSEKFRTQPSWGVSGLGNEMDKGGIRKAITDILKMWDFDSSNFHLILKDKVRQSKVSFNLKKLKRYYQVAVRMATIEPCGIT